MIDSATVVLALGSGALIGLILGLVGGGGSILAVPLLVYVVGVESPHVAIGTAAVAVALNAASSLVGHHRAGTVKWPCALVFAGAGALGAALGAELGKATDGTRLLALFGGMMVLVGLTMLRPRRSAEKPDVRLHPDTARHLLPRLVPAGFAVGSLAGFFGIGGGFLIVPALILATGMPLRNAVGTSLVVVTTLGLATAASYTLSGQVDWGLVTILLAGGIVGSLAGTALGRRWTTKRRAMEVGFAAVVIGAGLYVVVRGL